LKQIRHSKQEEKRNSKKRKNKGNFQHRPCGNIEIRKRSAAKRENLPRLKKKTDLPDEVGTRSGRQGL